MREKNKVCGYFFTKCLAQKMTNKIENFEKNQFKKKKGRGQVTQQLR